MGLTNYIGSLADLFAHSSRTSASKVYRTFSWPEITILNFRFRPGAVVRDTGASPLVIRSLRPGCPFSGVQLVQLLPFAEGDSIAGDVHFAFLYGLGAGERIIAPQGNQTVTAGDTLHLSDPKPRSTPFKRYCAIATLFHRLSGYVARSVDTGFVTPRVVFTSLINLADTPFTIVRLIIG